MLKHISVKLLNIFGNYFRLAGEVLRMLFYAHDSSRHLGHSFTHTLHFDLLSLQITCADNGITTALVFIHVYSYQKVWRTFLAVMITSKLILQIIAHNSAQYLCTIVNNYPQYIVQYCTQYIVQV